MAQQKRQIELELEWCKDGGAFGGESWTDASNKYPSALDKYHGKTYFHPGRGHLYLVVGTVYQSEDNRWELAYRRISQGGAQSGPLFTHRPEDFLREGRFMEVKK